jgi:hypothetical protein
MLRLNLVSNNEVIHEFLDGLPAFLRVQVDYINLWPEVVIEVHTRSANARPERRGTADVEMQTGRTIPRPLQAVRPHASDRLS